MVDINTANKDRDLSFAIINYLSASLRGRIAAVTVLGQFQHSEFDIAELEQLQANNERVNDWIEGCLAGETLLSTSWSSPETFEAQSSLAMLAKLKPDLTATADRIETYLTGEQAISVSSVQWLFSALIRSAFARDIYIRGFLTFGQAFQKQELIENYSKLIPGSEERILSINQGIELFKATEYDLSKLETEFLDTLITLAEDLPAVFRTQIHDLNLLGSNYRGGPTAENLGFSEEEAQAWQQIGFPLDIAGYWRAYSLSPQESLTWVNVEARDPASVFGWKINKFNPQSSKHWIEYGIPPQLARIWGEAGKTPQEAREKLQMGIVDPNFEPPAEVPE